MHKFAKMRKATAILRKMTGGGGKLTALLALAASVALPNAANATTAAYSAGDASLADGKITVEYDANGKVTRLSMRPGQDETLTLTGDALSFADGASIVPGANGTAVISNALSFDGAVTVGATNIVWSDAATLPKNSYATVFENVQLDDISPVSATVYGTSDGLPEAGKPYYVTRIGSGASAKVTVQFQTDKGGYLNNTSPGGSADQTKIVRVEFIQDGDNVKAKVLDAALLPRTRLHGYDITTTLNTAANQTTKDVYSSDNQVSGGYGISAIVFSPRYEYYFCNDTLTTSDTIVASGANVEDIEILYALKGSSHCLMPYHVTCENGVLTAQMIQQYDSQACIKIQLSQSGSDVVARMLYAKTLAATPADVPADYDEIGTVVNNISIKGLALRQKTKNAKLKFLSHGATTLNAVSGANVDVTFETAEGTTASDVTTGNLFPAVNTWVTLASNVAVGDIKVTGAVLGGKSAGSGFHVVDFNNNGTIATFQAQSSEGSFFRCINVSLRQNGSDVECTIATPYYSDNSGYMEAYYGKKSLPSSLKAGDNTAATGNTARGVNIKTLTYSAVPSAYIYATGANTMTDSSFALDGGENGKMKFYARNASAIPSTLQFDCYSGSELVVDQASTYNNGIVAGQVTAHAGSVVSTPQDFAFHRASGKVVLDGATLNNTAEQAYFNYIAFSNAASVASASGDLRAGGRGTPVWSVGGTGMSTLEGDIRLVPITGKPSLTIDVADTVAGDGVDFMVAGAIEDLQIQSNNIGYLVKTGAGTMQLDGVVTSTGGALSIAEGTLLLGASSATASTNFSLDGGALALAAGTANEAATLYVTEDSSLIVGDGATLVLSDVVVSEGATLNVAGAGRSSLQVTGTLTGATLSRIRIDGNRTRQDADGYLRRNCGLIISFH